MTPAEARRLLGAGALVLALALSACGSDDSDGISTLPTSLTTTTASTPEFPPPRGDLEHGGSTWAVVLAAAPTPEDPAIAAAVEAAEDAGYQGGPTDCDEGAAEALGRADDSYTVSVYFGTEVEARAAALAFEARGVAGVVATIRTYCLD